MKEEYIRCSGCLHEKSFVWAKQIDSFVCEVCKKPNYRTSQGNFQTLSELTFSPNRKPQIPLRSRIVFHTGELREGIVIGCAIKSEAKNPTYYWEEYVVMAKEKHLYFLCSFDTTWSLLQEVDTEIDIKVRPYSLYFRRREHSLDHDIKVQLRYAEGYFPYSIQALHKGEIRNVEYLDDKNIFSIEVNSSDNTQKTFAGNFLSAKRMREALEFVDKGSEIPINEYDYRETRREQSYIALGVGFVASLLLCWLLLIALKEFDKPKVVFDTTFNVNSKTAKQPIVHTFDIPGNEVSNMHVIANHYKENSWAYLDLTLLNERTDDERSFEIEIEHYSGVDGGESWSEGSYETEKNLNEIQSGPYRITIVPDADFGPTNSYSTSYLADTTIVHTISLKAVFKPESYHNLWQVVLLWVACFLLYFALVKFHEVDMFPYKIMYQIENVIWKKFALLWIMCGLSLILVSWGRLRGTEIWNNAAPANGMNMTQQGIHHK